MAQDVAKLDYNVRRETNEGKEIIRNNIYRLINLRPNNYTSAYNFWYNIIFNMLGFGNGYAYIRREKMQPVELYILHPEEVTCHVYDGEVFYRYKNIWIPQMDMLHYKLYSFDGIEGVSPIIWNAETFGYRLKQDKYKAKVLGQKPPGFLSFDQVLNENQKEQNKKMWQSAVQGENLGGTPVLSGGARYVPLMVPPNEGQMIEAAKLNDQKICGIYRVPLAKLQNLDGGTHSNVSQQDTSYAKDSLTPILTCIEQETNWKLFSEAEKFSDTPLYTKFDIKGILRGDPLTQSQINRELWAIGAINADEIREQEDKPPLPDGLGKKFFVQAGFMPVDKAEEFYTSENSTGERSLGFDIMEIKRHLSRLETQNNA